MLPDTAFRVDLVEPEDDARSALRQALHQTNNYLSVVRSHAELALAKDDPARARRALEVILARADDLQRAQRELRRSARL
ncbi:MAG: hypothetical protein JNJ88_00360 [Planctomycetes bacterium]|nr:hypothetical protein [Planctomycetota bacterium]